MAKGYLNNAVLFVSENTNKFNKQCGEVNLEDEEQPRTLPARNIRKSS